MNDKSTPSWTWQELASATNGSWEGLDIADKTASTGVTDAVIDSRTVTPGELFFALPGDLSDRFHVSATSTRDGHDFVAGAAQSGAAAAVVSRSADVPITQLVVEDTVDALWALARAGRRRLNADVVAVTGSSGKTTAKAMLQGVMGGYATVGSLNNHLGVPLSLINAPRETTTAAFEIGTSSPGEIAPLAKLVAPDVAIVLNVHPAHIANFANLEALRAEKLSIAQGLASDGVLVLLDDLAPYASHANIVTFGESASAQIRLIDVDGDIARYHTSQGELTAKVPGGGHHRALTLGAVIACMQALGRDLQAAVELPDDCVPRGRGDVRTVAGVTVVDDSYNANPASMLAALEAFRSRPAQRRFVLLGEMLELGENSARHHQTLAAQLTAFDGAWLVGEGFTALGQLDNEVGRSLVADEALMGSICDTLQPGDSLFIKGSNRVFWTSGFTEKLRQAIAASL